jgi:membrane protein YdbS with pleckstrin-like domain
VYSAPVDAPLPESRQRLDPRVVQVHRISHGIFTAVLLVSALLTTNIAALAGASWRKAAAFVVLALVGAWIVWRLGHRWAQRSYDHTSYVVSPDGLEIARGVYWRQIVSVPRSRIQHTDVTQGPLQRSYELSTLVLYTAGAEHARIALDGLAFDTALALREDLLRSDGPSAPPAAAAGPAGPAEDVVSEDLDDQRA